MAEVTSLGRWSGLCGSSKTNQFPSAWTASTETATETADECVSAMLRPNALVHTQSAADSALSAQLIEDGFQTHWHVGWRVMSKIGDTARAMVINSGKAFSSDTNYLVGS